MIGPITAGYRCERCGCSFDIYGNFHSPIQEQIIEVKTNADKIRSMTDEELADFMVNGTNIICKECPLKYDHCDGGNICKNRALKWLKQSTK